MYLSCRDYYCCISSCDSIAKNVIILFFYNLVEEVTNISTRNQISLSQTLCLLYICCCVSNAQGEIEFCFFFSLFSSRSVIEVIKK